MKTKFVLLILVPIFLKLNAQEVSIDSSIKKDSTNEYYLDLSDQLLVKVFTSTSFLKLGITNKQAKELIQLDPLGILNIGGAFNYKWLGIGVSFGLPSNDLEVSKKGKTTRLDLMLNVYNRRFVIDGFYQNYRGYHLSNAASLADWKSDTLPQFSNFRQEALIISGLYILNHEKFSIKSAFVKNSIQLKSAGSLIVGFFFNYDAASNPSGFLDNDSINVALKNNFPFSAFTSSNVGISAGYSYNFVLSKYWYANATMAIGVGVNEFNADTLHINPISNEVATGSINETRIGSQVLLRASLGYERNNFIVGFNYIGNVRGITFNDYDINPFSYNIRFFVAKRFGGSSSLM